MDKFPKIADRVLLSEVYSILNQALPSEQCVYLMIEGVLLEFFQYFLSVVRNVQEEQRGDVGGSFIKLHELQFGLLNHLLEPLEDYRLREAVVIFDERIDWEYIQKNALVFVIRAGEILERGRFTDADCVINGLQQILMVAGTDSPILPTPQDICRMIQQLVPGDELSMAEIYCGNGGISSEIIRQIRPEQRGFFRYYGEDNRTICCAYTYIRLWLSGVRGSWILLRDPLQQSLWQAERYQSGEREELERYPLIVADLPVGNNRSMKVEGRNPWLRGMKLRSIYSDWLIIQDILYRLEDGGRAYILTTRGALVRKNEQELRRFVMEKNWLEAVVTLPRNLYLNHSMERELLIFHKNREVSEKVTFIDLSSFSCRESRDHFRITQEGYEYLRFLVPSSEKGLHEEKIFEDANCRVVDRERVMENHSSWNPREYLEEQENGGGIPLGEVAVVTRGIQLPRKEEMALDYENGTHYFLNIRNLENGEIRYKDCKKIRVRRAIWMSKYQIQEDDILMTTRGSTIKILLVPPDPPPALICGNLTIIRTIRDRYHPYVLFEYLNSEQGQKVLQWIQTGTTTNLLNSSRLEQVRIPDYETGKVLEIGERMKQNELEYQRKWADLKYNYHAKKEKMIKEILSTDEKNIYQSQQ